MNQTLTTQLLKKAMNDVLRIVNFAGDPQKYIEKFITRSTKETIVELLRLVKPSVSDKIRSAMYEKSELPLAKEILMQYIPHDTYLKTQSRVNQLMLEEFVLYSTQMANIQSKQQVNSYLSQLQLSA